MNVPVKTRWQAFGIHLGLSAVIFAAIYAITRLIWFPGALFDLANTWEGIRILVVVDLVLGPLLTLVVFDLKRKEMKVIARDLTVILMIQLGGLLGGIWVIHGEKPVLATYVFNTLHIYTASDIHQHKVWDRFESVRDKTPTILYSELPQERKQAEEVLRVHRALIGAAGTGLEADLWQSIPPDESGLKNMLRFTDDIKPLEGCDAVTVKASSKHTAGRMCVDFRNREFSLFTPDQQGGS
ncbi:MAG: hypothetical protein ACPG4N_11670 [Gammaproteobacteria bacterium]